MYCTTNKRSCLNNLQEIDLEVAGHDGSMSRCTLKGNLIFEYLEYILRHFTILCYSTYSNLISDQRTDNYLLTHTGNTAK